MLNSIGVEFLHLMVKTIIIDVDGVLTDGKVWYTSTGERSKGFHSRDIRAIRELTGRGFDVYLLTQSTWPGVDDFAARTGATVVTAIDKFKWIQENNITDYIAVADDVSDLVLLENASISCCPSDADFLIKEVEAMIKLSAKGGDGVIAELVKLIS